MPYPRWLAATGIALGALALGCFTNGQNGDPASAFSSGTGTSPPDGHAGNHEMGHGGAGASTDAGTKDASAKDATTRDAGAEASAGDAGSETDGATEAGATEGGAKPAACAVGATATFSFAWSVEDATGASSTCDAVGGKTVDLDVVNLTTGAEALSTTPCAALAATTCAMPAGSYSVSMKLRDANGGVLSEIFAPTLILANGGSTVVDSLPLQVGGTDAAKGRGFALTWSIDRVGSGAIETCAQAGAATVRLTAGTTTFDLTCADGKGRTTSIAPGSYPVTIDLLDANGAKLSETQTMSVAIGAGQLVFLGDVPFDVN